MSFHFGISFTSLGKLHVICFYLRWIPAEFAGSPSSASPGTCLDATRRVATLEWAKVTANRQCERLLLSWTSHGYQRNSADDVR